MDSPVDNQSAQQDSDPTEALESGESAAELKAKLHANDGVSTMNHVGESGQNGFASMNNHVAKAKESSSHSHSSSSKSKDGHHSSSSSKPKDHHSSSSSKHKDGSSSSSKHRDGSSSKHKEGSSSSSSKHKEGGSSSSSKHKEGSSSSSSKHKEGSSSSSSKHKEGSSSSSSKHKEGSSSSSSKHKEGESSSSPSKHKEGSSSSSSKHKEGHHSSSSSKHKEGSSSHTKDKHSSEQKLDKISSPVKEGEKKPSDGDLKAKISSEHKDKSKESGHRHDKHRDKHSTGSSGDKHSTGSSGDKHSTGSSGEKKEKHRDDKASDKSKIKQEPGSPTKSASPSKSSHSPVKQAEVKPEPQSDDDVPLSSRIKPEKAMKRPADDSDDDVPLSARVKKVKTEDTGVKETKKRKNQDESEDEKPLKKKKKKVKVETTTSPKKGRVKKEEQKEEVWKWWEEERRDDGVKWNFLEHKGPQVAPDYEPLPSNVHFYYNGKKMKLVPKTEEVATFYARMLEHDYTTRDVFNNNFMKDWRKQMSSAEREQITDIKKCKFNEIADHFKQKTEDRKAMSKEERLANKKKNEEILKEYGFCKMDGHVEKIGNFRIEPPGLFRGRGDHPKQGMLKTRTQPEDVIINCSKGAVVPIAPPGHKWKEVRHDNTVSWLACWQENVQNQTKYVMLNAASRLKGEKDWQKYEVARKLHKCVDKIRATYRQDLKSKEMRIRQRAVALYFIDKLALRAGNEKETDETADTVGCCSLRVEHLTLHEKMDDQEYVVEFDFLGKDSIRYYNKVSVDKRVYKNVELFTDNKQPEDDVFDRLNTTILNKHLQLLMEGLTAKVFRTFNASRTLQEQLDLLTNVDDSVPAKLLSYNRANRAVAILCNHQRAVPKNFDKQMENLQTKIVEKRQTIKEAKKQMKDAKSDLKACKTQSKKSIYDKKKKAVERLEDQLTKLEVQATDKDENKEIALGTSKLNYLDPRISVAWCKKFEVPIEKIYNKTQRDKFRWAIDMAGAEFVF